MIRIGTFNFLITKAAADTALPVPERLERKIIKLSKDKFQNIN